MSRFDSLRDNFIKNKILVENFTFLSALHVTNLVLFLITIPYLFRVLGSRNYGLVIFAQTIAFYFSIFVNFGFNLTATKDISVQREDAEKVSEIVSSVLTIKIVFFLISILLMSLLTSIIPILRENRLLFLFSMLACLSEALFPVWYFQGIEKMKYITFINVTTRVLATILVFIVIGKQSDFVVYPLILGIGTVSGALFALALVFRKRRIIFRFQKVKVLVNYFNENLLYFLSNVSTQIYANANKIIIGSFLGMVEVAYYDVAEKVINIVKVPYSLLGQTLFPKFSRDRNIAFLRKIIISTVIFTLGIIIILFLFSDIIVRFFSGTYNPETIDILRILSLSLIPISLSLFYGDLMLISFNLKNSYAKMRFFGLIFYLMVFVLLKFTGNLTVVSLAYLIVAVESLITGYSYLICKKAGILNFTSP
jgi:O-antigen/teichoic acid export membrane protein